MFLNFHKKHKTCFFIYAGDDALRNWPKPSDWSCDEDVACGVLQVFFYARGFRVSSTASRMSSTTVQAVEPWSAATTWWAAPADTTDVEGDTTIDLTWPDLVLFHPLVESGHYIVILPAVYHLRQDGLRSVVSIGVGAQSTLGGTTFLPEKYVRKINKMVKFILHDSGQYSNFYICPKN